MLVISICSVIQSAGYLLELRSATAAEALLATRMEYIGGAFIATFFLAMVLLYCGYKLPSKLFTFLAIFDGFVVMSVWTCEFNPLYYTSVSFVNNVSFPHIVLGKGYLYIANAVITASEMIASTIITAYSLRHIRDSKQRRNYLLLLSSLFFPLISYLLGVLGVFKGYDPVPVGVGIGIVVFAMAILFHHAFDLVESAHENIIQTMGEAVLIVDYNFCFVEANAKAQSLFPQLQENKRNWNMKEGEFAFLFETQEDSEVVLDGRTYYIHQNEIMIDNFMSGYVLLLFDITEERRQLEHMQNLKEEADRANRAKSSFFARVSHEIRTPINAVLGMDEMILRESRETQVKKYALDIKTAARTLLSLINDILDSSKLESGKMEIVPVEYELSRLLNDVYNMISVKAKEKQLDLKFEIDEDLPSVLWGDDIRVRQILLNLLSNAVKYTKEGKVSLKITGSKEGSQICLKVEVTDTGIGIKDEDLPRLSKAFERIDIGKNRMVEGTGLGISIVVQLLKMMDSTLQVESSYGKGSTFSFHLRQNVINQDPLGNFNEYLVQLEEEEVYDVSYIAPEAKVLVVDDNQTNRMVFKGLLKETQVQVQEADSGQACLEAIAREHFDVVFMDDMMPVMNGQETLQKMKQSEKNLCRDAKIIMLTANASPSAKEEYLQMGFDDFLSKPVQPEKLEILLGKLLPQEYVHRSMSKTEIKAIDSQYSEAETESDLPEIDGIHWDYARLHLPEEALWKETAENFCDSIPREIQKLQELIDCITEDQYLTEYRIHVHTIKSTAAMLGILSMSGIAEVLERAAREYHREQIQELHPSLITELELYQERLQLLHQDEENQEKADIKIILPLVELLRTALLERDFDAADDLMEKVSGYEYEEELQKQVNLLKSQVLNLEAEKGSITAETMIASMKKEEV